MKNKFIKVLAVTLIAASLAPQAAMAAPVNSKVQVSAAALTTAQKRNKVVSVARDQKGKPYKRAAAGPDSFDCSGLVVYVYKKALGINLPHKASQLMTKGTKVSRENLKPGDLVFPSDHHVGIYTGNGKFIHAPHEGEKVKEVPIYSFYTARRIIK